MQNAETILGSINHRRAACGESLQARFGGGPTEKARATGTSPAAYPTLKASGGPRGPSLSQCRRLEPGATHDRIPVCDSLRCTLRFTGPYM